MKQRVEVRVVSRQVGQFVGRNRAMEVHYRELAVGEA